MSLSHLKKRDSKGATPFELLAAAAGDVSSKVAMLATLRGKCPVEIGASLYREFYQAQKGRQLTRWSKGLKVLLDVDAVAAELDAADADADALDSERCIVRLSLAGWRRVVVLNLEADLMHIATNSNAVNLRCWLDAHGIDATLTDDFYRLM